MAAALSPSFIDSLKETSGSLTRAAIFGRNVAPHFDRVYMVGCGAPYRLMKIIQLFAEKYSRNTEFRACLSADFSAWEPPNLNKRTLVFFASKSGTTPETLDAAKFVGDMPYKTVVFTQEEKAPLVAYGDEVFLLGKAEDPLLAMSMLMLAVTGTILEEKEGWKLFDKLLSSLRALPKAFVAIAQNYDARAKEDAALFKTASYMTFVASGLEEPMAFVLGTCNLTEKLKIHTPVVKASDFFHGELETVDKSTPLILFLGEDTSRPLMERVQRFCGEHAEHVLIFDSRDYEMDGVDNEVRPILAPFVLRAAGKVWIESLAEQRKQSLTERTYMGKVRY